MPFLTADGLSLVDIAMLAIIMIGLPLETLLTVKHTRAKLASGAPGVRVSHYTSTIMYLWAVALPIVVLWAASGRDWAALGFHFEAGAMVSTGWLLAGVITLFFGYQYLAISMSEKGRQQLREGIARNPVMDGFMPQTSDERHLFNLLGITAGITEEIIFRAYLIWALATVMPIWAAALISLAIFTFLHIYQGAKILPAVFVIGGLVTLIYLWSGSIWPAIAVHVIVDILNNLTVFKARQVPA